MIHQKNPLYVPVLFLAIIGCLLSSFANSDDQTPRAVVHESSYDFGTVRRGAQVEATFSIRNEGKADLNIAGASISLPGLKIQVPQVIPPGGESKVVVQLRTAELSGDTAGNVVLHTNNPESPNLKFDIKGHVETLVEFQPTLGVFLQAFRWEIDKAETKVSMVNKDKKPLKILDFKSEGDEFIAKITPTQEGQSYQISAKFSPKAMTGRSTGRITIQTDQETIYVPVYTFLKDKVYLVPNNVSLGQINLKQIEGNPQFLDYRKQSIFIYQHHGQDFQIQIQSAPEFVTIERTPPQGPGSVIEIPNDGKTAVFELSVSPNKERLTKGRFEDSIVLTTNDKEFPVIKIPVSMEVT